MSGKAKALNHAQLVRIAKKWLIKARGCNVVLAERAEPTTGETPDVIGWKGRHSILIECKASRADFRRDKDKWFRHGYGLGQQRFFLAAEGVIPAQEVPEGWGLLEVRGTVVKTSLEENLIYHDEKIAAAEVPLLVASLRRALMDLNSRGGPRPRRRRRRKKKSSRDT